MQPEGFLLKLFIWIYQALPGMGRTGVHLCIVWELGIKSSGWPRVKGRQDGGEKCKRVGDWLA